MIAMASQQIDRLHRWGATVGGYGRQDADEAASDITVRRDRVLQDARELQLQPPTVFESLRATLSRDLADLEASMRSSWSILPPPSSGMPPPAPLPPP